MKIFLDEPLIDWQRNAHLQSKTMRPTASSSGPDGAQQQAPMDVAAFGRLQLRMANLKLGMLTCCRCHCRRCLLPAVCCPPHVWQVLLADTCAFKFMMQHRGAAHTTRSCCNIAGINPMNVLVEQLRDSKHSRKPETWTQHKKTIKAETHQARGRRRRKDDVRSAKYLDVQQQVEVLIDLATDPNVLGRQWAGAALWI
eukprot:COSAG02_NODE_1591_length_11781_cov_861.345403_3_plen_198_part_00